MFKKILLAFIVTTNSFALEISIDSAKDNFIKYYTLTISDTDTFLCQEIKDDFDVTTEIICTFSKMPSEDIQNIQNDFFKVNSLKKSDAFFITIKPLYKIKLIADIFDLTKDDTVFSADVKFAKRWSVVGYKDTFPLFEEKQKSALALNLPFYLDKDKFPFVGGLDLEGNPVHIKKVEDVTEYLKVKEDFAQKRYDDALDIIEAVLQNYPHTLFKSEFIYYKIKVYDKLKDYENVISNAKLFLREYSSDENIPEVLALIAKAYAQIEQPSDADYFFDRLFSEHKGNKFAQWGYIYKGEMLEASGGDSQALKYYKKALYETRDLDVAASAAYHLSQMLVENNPKEAAKYAMKIIKAKPSYFMKNLKSSIDLMQALADADEYKVAATIADTMLKNMGPTYDEYESLLKDKALWLAKTDDKKAALEALNDYLKKFPDGDYIDKIQVAKDGLFFESSDANSSVKLAKYNKLIAEYKGDSIGERALYEKAKLLLKEKKYADLLSMKKELATLDRETFKDIDSIIHRAIIGLMESSLKNKNCKNVLVIANDYNISLSNSWDNGIYECAMKGGDFQLSKSIASKNLATKDLQERKKWLYRYIRIDFETGNYSELIDAAKDLIALIDNEKTSPYKDIYRYLFDAYERLNEKENMIKTMAKIEDIFGVNYKDIDRYVAMISLGTALKDDNMVIHYGTNVMKIQKASHSYAQTPYVEFTLYGAYMNQNEYKKALEVIKSLDQRSLSKDVRARQKYLLGMVLSKLHRDKEAKKAYEEAIKADANSAWAKLAKSALEL